MQYGRPLTTLLTTIISIFCLRRETPSHTELTSQRRLLIKPSNAADYLIYIKSRGKRERRTSDTVKETRRRRERARTRRKQAGNEVPTASG